MAIRLFSDPVRVLSIGRNPIQVLLIRSDPVRVSIRSDPIRSRFCKRPEQCGSYLGSRVTKCCRTCKIYEHYGYWTSDGKRQLNDDCLANEFLLSSENTAFQNALVKQCANFLVVGAMPFATFAQTFNRRFGCYGRSKSNESGIQSGPAVKRMKR